jgi:peptide alpha-N-acetyltransferase
LAKEVYPDGTEIQSPSEYLWSLYLLAQHFGRKFETLPRAYDYIKRAIAHTNTVPEFYLVKAEL